MVLNKNPENYFAEVEQAAFGTGVLVDGMDFSDDKMLQGRTLSYSDTQRYRVGPNYLQLPINAPKKRVATNQRDGQMTYYVDMAPGQNPHINYEPSSLNGLKEAPRKEIDYMPHVEGKLMRASIERTNDYKQAGETYRAFDDFEKNELISNLVNALSSCSPVIQEKMIHHLTQCDEEYGRRVAEGIKQHGSSSHHGPLGATHTHEAVEDAERKGHSTDSY
jgi:catalase